MKVLGHGVKAAELVVLVDMLEPGLFSRADQRVRSQLTGAEWTLQGVRTGPLSLVLYGPEALPRIGDVLELVRDAVSVSKTYPPWRER